MKLLRSTGVTGVAPAALLFSATTSPAKTSTTPPRFTPGLKNRPDQPEEPHLTVAAKLLLSQASFVANIQTSGFHFFAPAHPPTQGTSIGGPSFLLPSHAAATHNYRAQTQPDPLVDGRAMLSHCRTADFLNGLPMTVRYLPPSCPAITLSLCAQSAIQYVHSNHLIPGSRYASSP